jgi:hypothetical protein
VPTYVIDAPGGGGKIPVMPNYLISYSDHKVVLRNYEGYITTYEEPLEYKAHDKATCAACQQTRPEPGQSGVHGLLQGEQMWIEPKGFEQTHTRGNTEAHRLQDPSKWVPFGVGAIEGQAQQPLRVLQSGETEPDYGRARSRGRARASRPRRPTGAALGSPVCPTTCRRLRGWRSARRLGRGGPDDRRDPGRVRRPGVPVHAAATRARAERAIVPAIPRG